LLHYAFVHAQEPAQRHCEPQPQAIAGLRSWQPHLQLDPGHLLQRQAFDFASFMMILQCVRGE
jgi:hypothetical protein